MFPERHIYSECRVVTLSLGLRADKANPTIFSLTGVIEGISTG